MTAPLYICGYTEKYYKPAMELVASLDRYNLPHHVRAMGEQGSWQANCMEKPKFIHNLLVNNPGQPLVWVDADALIRRYPERIDKLAQENWSAAIPRWQRPDRNMRWEVLSGTLYFGGDWGSIDLVGKWVEECQANPTAWDQMLLGRALTKTSARCTWLPLEYCFIFDSFRKVYPGMVPVIEHFQHSRLHRR